MLRNCCICIGIVFFSLLTVCAPAFAQAEETLGKPREDLRVQYAKVRLQLAESELGERLRMNKKLKGTVEREEMDHFRARVKIAKEQLKLAQTLSAGTATPTQLTAANATFDRAQRDYHAVKGATTDVWCYNGQVPGPTFRCTEGWFHISTFIAGATQTASVKQRYKVLTKSSLRPLAAFARKFAVAGATIINSLSRASSM